MSAALNNVTAPDKFGASAELKCPNTARVRLQVNNQAIYWQRGIQVPGAGGIEWVSPEEFLLPGLYSLDESCEAIRIRAAIPLAKLSGSPQAQVTIATRTRNELGE